MEKIANDKYRNLVQYTRHARVSASDDVAMYFYIILMGTGTIPVSLP